VKRALNLWQCQDDDRGVDGSDKDTNHHDKQGEVLVRWLGRGDGRAWQVALSGHGNAAAINGSSPMSRTS
jgi:hypothetical protein